MLQHLSLALILSVSAALPACGGGADDGPPQDAPARLQSVADQAVRDGLVGVALGQAGALGEGLARAGVRRVGGGQALAADDFFALGSNTKAMTAVVAAAVVEQGRLRWDSKVLDVLPGLQASTHPAYREVTLAQLLDHLGGVWAFTGDEDIDAFAAGFTGPIPPTLTERRLAFARWVLAQPPRAGVAPGRFSYSNAGYAIASAMLEAASGNRFEALFAAHVAQPLQLPGHWKRPNCIAATQPDGHAGPRGRVTAFPPYDEGMQLLNETMNAAGGYSTTAPTYRAWLQWHLQALAGRATPLPTGYVARLRSAKEGEYVLGWARLSVDGRATLAHLGEDEGFTSFAMLTQDGREATFGLTNTTSDPGSAWVAEALQGAALKARAVFAR